jgi:hypothetical protein
VYARATHDDAGEHLVAVLGVLLLQRAFTPIAGGIHERDWQMIQIRLDCDWEFVEKLEFDANVPIVHVAADSHASYLRRGLTAIDVPIVPDVVTEIVVDATPRWVKRPGTWGALSEGSFRSPRTPSQQASWQYPLAFDLENRRSD